MLTVLQEVAEHFTLDPLQLLKLQCVSKQFRQVFSSDHVWRYMNVYGVESGICDHFLASLSPTERAEFKRISTRLPHGTPSTYVDHLRASLLPPPTSQNLYFWLLHLRDRNFDAVHEPFMTTQFYWCAVHWNPSIIRLCADRLELDPETYAKALERDLFTYAFLPLRMRQNKELLMRVLKTSTNEEATHFLANRVPQEFLEDKEILYALIEYDPMFLMHMPPRFKRDPQLVAIAVRSYVAIFDTLPPVIQQNRQVTLAAVSTDGQRIALAPLYADDQEMVLVAVANKGVALQYASPRLRSSKEVVLRAVAQDGIAAKFMDPSLRDDMHVAAVAVKSNWLAVEYFPQVLYHRKLVLQLVKKAPRVVAMLPGPLALDLEFCSK